MATTIEKKMMTQLDELYANESKLNREIASYNNQLVDDDLKEHDRIATEKFLSAAEVNLASNNHKIEQLNGHVLELQSKEKEANEKKFAEFSLRLTDAMTMAQNHIHTVDTKVDGLIKVVAEMDKQLTHLATVIEERIPKK